MGLTDPNEASMGTNHAGHGPFAQLFHRSSWEQVSAKEGLEAPRGKQIAESQPNKDVL